MSKIILLWVLVCKYLLLVICIFVIGVVVGVLFGVGGDIVVFMVYDYVKCMVKNFLCLFGEGVYEGLVVFELVNNVVVGGVYVFMLMLGILGDVVMVVIIGVFYIYGLKLGLMLMIEILYLFWFVVGLFCLVNIFLLIFGLIGIKIFVKIVEMFKLVLLLLILVLLVVGVYVINNNLVDVYWMLGFGVFGYFFKMYGF